MAIKDWSTTAASNNSASPDGFPEGMAPSGVNDSAREVMAQVRGWYEAPEWRNLGHTTAYVAAGQFKIAGSDVTADYPVGMAVRAVGSTTGTIYGVINASSFSTDTTITVDWYSGNLENETLTISVGSISGSNGAVGHYTVNAAEVVINEASLAIDFRVESGTVTNAFLVDSSADQIEINVATDLNGKELILDADGDTSITADTDDQIDIKVGGSDYVRINAASIGIGITSPDGTVHVHSGSAGSVTASVNADEMVAEGSGNTGISILSPDANNSFLVFGSPTAATGSYVGWKHSTGLLQISSGISAGQVVLYSGNQTEALRLDASQNVVAGPTGAATTTATDGFLYVPTCSGVPTGTPTAKTGKAAVIVDSAADALYFHDGSAWANAGVGAKGWEQVTAVAIASATSIDFTGLVADYDYQFAVRGVRPQSESSAIFAMQLSDDNGVSFYAGAGDYGHVRWGLDWDDSALTIATDTAHTDIPIGSVIGVAGAAAGESANYDVTLHNPNVATVKTIVKHEASMLNNIGRLEHSQGSGVLNTTVAVDAVRFLFEGSNVFEATGNIALFRRPLT